MNYAPTDRAAAEEIERLRAENARMRVNYLDALGRLNASVGVRDDLRAENDRLRRDLDVLTSREAERMATAAIATPAPLLDNTVFLDAADAIDREIAVLLAWTDDKEALDVLVEAAHRLQEIGELAKAGAPNERGYPEITVRVQGVSVRDE